MKAKWVERESGRYALRGDDPCNQFIATVVCDFLRQDWYWFPEIVNLIWPDGTRTHRRFDTKELAQADCLRCLRAALRATLAQVEDE